ncbi:MAG TPA: hypothetical protein VEJ63_00570, partial [Planctomycetota bacterium]|nr:hypothetical protein [Planctomycetota bacterium]
FQLQIPDLAAARALLGDLSNRAPWFGDIGLAGPGSVAGTIKFEPGKFALSGRMSFNESTVIIGKKTPLTLSGLNGGVPFIVREGEVETPKDLTEKLRLGAITLGPISAPAQQLGLVAMPNGLRITTPYSLRVPDGEFTLTDTAYTQKTDSREISFKLGARCDLSALLKRSGVTLNGMDDCVLGGPALACRIVEKRSTLGSDWSLESSGDLRAPFFGGEIRIANLYARGLFGPAPVFGVNEVSASAPEGIKITQLVDKNQHLLFTESQRADPEFVPAKFALRANVEIKSLRISGFDPGSILSFVANVSSAEYKENDYYYNGALAMWLNYPLVRASFPKVLFNDEAIRKLHFGVRHLGFQYELKDGILEGPRPLLPNNLIIEGYGSEMNPFAQTYKKDIEAEHHIDADGRKRHGTRLVWREVMEKASKGAK